MHCFLGGQEYDSDQELEKEKANLLAQLMKEMGLFKDDAVSSLAVIVFLFTHSNPASWLTISSLLRLFGNSSLPITFATVSALKNDKIAFDFADFFH